MGLVFFFTLILFSTVGFWLGRNKASNLALLLSHGRLHSRPFYHGCYIVLWCCLPALVGLLIWATAQPLIVRSKVFGSLGALLDGKTSAEIEVLYAEVKNIASGAMALSNQAPEIVGAAEIYVSSTQSVQKWFYASLVLLSIAAATLAYRRIAPGLRARIFVEKCFRAGLFVCSSIAVLTTAGIVISLLFESLRFFNRVPISEFLFGTHWSPQMAIRSDQVASSGAFGAVPLFLGSTLIALIAMCVAVPCGLLSAIYFSEYASRAVRAVAKPTLEVLAGIPTVVYGFFAALTVAPYVAGIGASLGLDVSTESALAAGLVMGIMIIPFISSLSDDVINAVPQNLRDGSYALGATKSETIQKVIIPAALPGIMGSILLAISRAIGETMIVVMAAGLAANLSFNPLSNVTTVTVQIVTTLVGDQEFESAKTLSAFALGLVLFVITLVLNIIALTFVNRYRERYE